MEKGVIVVGKVERIWKVRKVGFIIKLTAHFIGKLNYTRSPPSPQGITACPAPFSSFLFPPLVASLSHTHIYKAGYEFEEINVPPEFKC